LLDLAHTDYFLFWRRKKELTGVVSTSESLQEIREGVIWKIHISMFTIAFRQ
jgi:hypothetical protein